MSELVEQFRRDGFVPVTNPVCDRAEVAAVRAVVEHVLATSAPHHDLATGGPEGGRIDEVEHVLDAEPSLGDSALFAGVRRLVEELLGGPVAVHYDHVIAKPPRNLAPTAWHQDAAYAVREREPVPAAHCWIPLHDVSVDHGVMTFVPGSHDRVVRHRRRGGLRSPVLEARSVDEASAIVCPLPAGGFTVHHPRVLHATGANRTDEWRIAWIVQLRPAGSTSKPSLTGRARHAIRRRVIG